MGIANTEMLQKSITVGIADAKVSSDTESVLATYSLGSCLGVCLYSRSEQIGGMLHCLLPDSTENPEKAQENPYTFADTGMKNLLEEMESRGIKKKELKVKIAGGAGRLKTKAEKFDIGKRNYLAIRKALWKYGMFIESQDVGGNVPRTLYMCIDDGKVIVKSNGTEKIL